MDLPKNRVHTSQSGGSSFPIPKFTIIAAFFPPYARIRPMTVERVVLPRGHFTSVPSGALQI